MRSALHHLIHFCDPQHLRPWFSGLVLIGTLFITVPNLAQTATANGTAETATTTQPIEDPAVIANRVRNILSQVDRIGIPETAAAQGTQKPDVLVMPEPAQTTGPASSSSTSASSESESELLVLPPDESEFAGKTLGDLIRASGQEPPTDEEAQTVNFGSGWVLNTLGALGIVIGLIVLTRVVWSKLTGQAVATGTNARVVEVLSRTAVAPRNHVVLMRVGQRILICSDSGNGMNTLSEVTDPEEVAELLTTVSSNEPTSISNSFNAMISRFNGEYDPAAVHEDEGLDHAEHTLDRSREKVSALLSKMRQMSSHSSSNLGSGSSGNSRSKRRLNIDV